jgi:hypothetical protein
LSCRVARCGMRALLLSEPPSVDGVEITDKRRIDQRAK